MKHQPPSTSHQPRILLSNDDGIHAEGLKTLEAIARALSNDITIVAPETEQSGAGHSLTLHIPVRLRKLEEKRYAVSGTPTDCVLLALKELMKKELPALLLSGVNRGSNVGDDVTYSGTIAAAMEGTLLGIPSIALSLLFDDPEQIYWQTAEQHAPEIIRTLMKSGWPKDTLINLNFPNCPPEKVRGVKLCSQGKRVMNIAFSERKDQRGRPYYWLGGDRDNTAEKDGVDITWLDAGYITITPIHMDLTDYKTLEALRASFSA